MEGGPAFFATEPDMPHILDVTAHYSRFALAGYGDTFPDRGTLY